MEYALITGATGGIGYAFAECFAKEGYGLMLVASDRGRLVAAKDRLLQKYKVPIRVYEQDLSSPKAAEELYKKIQDGQQITFLINNAGFGLLGATDKIDMEKEEQMLTLNMITPVKLTKLFGQDMLKRKRGYILNVASTGAFQPGPYNSTYYASKAFLYNYSRAVRCEWKKRGVSVSTLCPGTTRTRFFERAGTKTPVFAMTPERVAAYAYRKLRKRKDVIVPGCLNQLLRFVPVSIKLAGVAVMKERQAAKKV